MRLPVCSLLLLVGLTAVAGAQPRARVFVAQHAAGGGAYLGVGLLEIDQARATELGLPEPYGVELSNVAADSPAGRAGLEKGDVVLRYRGQRVEGVEHFIRLVRETPVGRDVVLTVWRHGAERTVNVGIGRRQEAISRPSFLCGDEEEDCEIHIPEIHIPDLRFDFDIPRPRIVMQSRLLGAELEGLEGQLAEYFGVAEGVLVRSVEPDSPAGRGDLAAGDVILSVDGRPVREPGEVRKAIQQASPDKKVPLEVMRKGAKKTLELEAIGRGSLQQPSRGRVRRSLGERL